METSGRTKPSLTLGESAERKAGCGKSTRTQPGVRNFCCCHTRPGCGLLFVRCFRPSPRTNQPVVPPGAHRRVVAVPGGDRALRPGALGPDADIGLRAWVRLRHLAVRFEALAAKVRAGRLPAAPVARLRAPPLPQRYRLPGRPQTYRLPRGFGWLLRLVPETVAYGGQVEHLLADPKMTALLAASPQAGRILRPLCHMLAIKPAPALAAPPRAKRPGPPAAAFPARRSQPRRFPPGCFPSRATAGSAAAHGRGAGAGPRASRPARGPVAWAPAPA